MKPLSETYKELGIAFTFPIKIKDANGKPTYFERSADYCEKWEYNAYGKVTYFENSNDYWWKVERDADGNRTYFEISTGYKEGTRSSAKTLEGKVVEVDGIKYKLTAL